MNILNSKATIDRWKTPEGKDKAKQIINALKNNTSLETLSFIEHIDGRYDLRGLYFDIKTHFKQVEIRNIDFSNSNFNYLVMSSCQIENVVFDKCDCTEMFQYNCCFDNCAFIRSKFLNAGFGINGGTYKRVRFENSSLKGAMFYYPDFYECSFINCKYGGVDFSYSHLVNVKFIGKLDDVWFKGEDPNFDTQKLWHIKDRGQNPMIVDFSDADLWFITYSDNCDLSRVILPKDGQHYLVNNMRKVIQVLEEEVSKIARTEEQKFVHEFVVMYKYHVVNQDMVILNFKNMVSNAEYYLGKYAEDYCKVFLEKIFKISNTNM